VTVHAPRLFLGAITAMLLYGAVLAAGDHPAFTDPESAGPDFRVQGEYLGTVGQSQPIGAQVIALGEGKFEGILFCGGLPGAGWDEQIYFHFRGEPRDGKTAVVGIHGERLQFDNTNLEGTIDNDTFRGSAHMFRNVVPNAEFVMQKVHRKSLTLGASPPPHALVLFDGSNTNEWADGKIVEEKLLDSGATTKREFGSLHLHLEFRTPFMPTAKGMGRGNSGVYVKRVWEVQIVDSFGWDNHNRKFERLGDFARCGGIHEMVQPRINMSFPPLAWQTYDVDFWAAQFNASGTMVSPEMITVRHNGVVIHDRYVLPAVKPGGDLSQAKARMNGPLFLQDHGNPVRFRNIWITTDPTAP